MAKCAVCNKSVHFGNAVSHSHRRSNKMWKPNLKSVRVKVNGGTKKMYVCTSCLRSGKVERAQEHITSRKEDKASGLMPDAYFTLWKSAGGKKI